MASVDAVDGQSLGSEHGAQESNHDKWPWTATRMQDLDESAVLNTGPCSNTLTSKCYGCTCLDCMKA